MIERSYVNLFDIFNIVIVMIIFGSVVTMFLSIYINTVISVNPVHSLRSEDIINV